jgi:hypothetical protein
MSTAATLEQCRAARLPKSSLAALASLRRLQAIRVQEEADGAWVFWDSALPSVIRALLPVPGVAFYFPEGKHWRPFGAFLPEFAVAKASARSLDSVVLPAAISAEPPPQFVGKRLPVRLAPSRRPHPATAMRCELSALQQWVETATTLEIQQLSGAILDTSVWLLGNPLPVMPGAERFWGNRVLVPLGSCPEPDWPENPLRWAARVDDDEILVLTNDGPEALPASAFRPLSRAAVRTVGSK